MNIIRVNGKKFRVRFNLRDFLQKARDCGYYVQFWIDAISINPIAIKERNQQVSVMGTIFSTASFVLV
jgi:hypothetical protein